MPYELAPWLDQPPATTPLNLTGPLARGLALYAPVVQQIGGRAADVKRFADGTFSGAAANRSSKLGRSVALDGSASTWLDFGSDVRLKSPDLTWTGSFVLKSLSNAYSAVFSYFSGVEYYQLLLKSNGKLAVYVKQALGNAVFYDGTGAFTLEAGRKYRLGFSVSATSGVARAFVNGRLDSATSGGVIAGGFNGSAVSVYLGNDSGTPGRLLSADVGNIALHLRELTALDHRSFAEREWQLFAPRRIFVPVAAAVAGATADLAATGQGGAFSGSASAPASATLSAVGVAGAFSGAAFTSAVASLAATGQPGAFSGAASSPAVAAVALTGASGAFSGTASSPAVAALAAVSASGEFSGAASTSATAVLAVTGQAGTFSGAASSPATAAIAITGQAGAFAGSASSPALAAAALTGQPGEFSGSAGSGTTAALAATGAPGQFSGTASSPALALLAALGQAGQFAGAASTSATAALAALGAEGAFSGSAFPLTRAELAALGLAGSFSGSASTSASASLAATGTAGAFSGSASVPPSARLAAVGASGSFAGTASGPGDVNGHSFYRFDVRRQDLRIDVPGIRRVT